MENDTKVAALTAEITDLKQQVQLLQEQLRLARQRQFGISSEKSVAIDGGEQLSIFNEAEAGANPAAEPALEQVAAHSRRKAKGKRELDFAGLPVEQVIHELPENERVCPDCGGPMHACGHEVYRRELTVVPAQFKVTEHVQTVYSCRGCEKTSDDAVPMLKSTVPAPVIRGSGVASPTASDTKNAVVLYEYQPDRRHNRPADFLDGWSGYLHTDGYQAYHKLPNVTVVGCLAHVRRRFADILKTLPEHARTGSEAMRGKEFCDRLFALEREFAKLPPDDNFRSRYEARLEKSKPVMDAFFDWAKNANALPQSAVGKAIAYALNERFYIEHILLDGRLELSNNRAERSIKPFVTGRKNWIFSDTVNGAKASATLYSVVETAKENGLHPFDYLEFVFRAAPGSDFGNDPAALERLLPWNAPPTLRRDAKPCAMLPWDET
jgi:hypothetical protein